MERQIVLSVGRPSDNRLWGDNFSWRAGVRWCKMGDNTARRVATFVRYEI
jgi:hypothetical protein